MLRHGGWASPISSAGMIRIRFEGFTLSLGSTGTPTETRVRQNAKDLVRVSGVRFGVSRSLELTGG